MNLTGKSKGKVERAQIINPDWDFSKMGIGGLDTQLMLYSGNVEKNLKSSVYYLLKRKVL